MWEYIASQFQSFAQCSLLVFTHLDIYISIFIPLIFMNIVKTFKLMNDKIISKNEGKNYHNRTLWCCFLVILSNGTVSEKFRLMLLMLFHLKSIKDVARELFLIYTIQVEKIVCAVKKDIMYSVTIFKSDGFISFF